MLVNNFLPEITSRQQNTSRLRSLQKGTCPCCTEQGVIREEGQNTWECYRCHTFFRADYVNLPRHTQKPAAYKDA